MIYNLVEPAAEGILKSVERQKHPCSEKKYKNKYIKI
jgi:hypothetical protein